MLWATRINFPKRGASTVEHKGRLVGPIPVSRQMPGRRKAYQSRFIDIGPPHASVWCAVAGGIHSKRTKKNSDPLDQRLRFKPIAKGYQQLYCAELRRGLHAKGVPRPRLRATNAELGKIMQNPAHDGYYFRGPDRFGTGPYYPADNGRVY